MNFVLLHFEWISGPFLDARTTLKSARCLPKRPRNSQLPFQDGPQDAPTVAPVASKTRSLSPQSAPRRAQEPQDPRKTLKHAPIGAISTHWTFIFTIIFVFFRSSLRYALIYENTSNPFFFTCFLGFRRWDPVCKSILHMFDITSISLSINNQYTSIHTQTRAGIHTY